MGITVTDTHQSIPMVVRVYAVSALADNDDNVVPHTLGYEPSFALAIATTAGTKAGVSVLDMDDAAVTLGVPTGVTDVTLIVG